MKTIKITRSNFWNNCSFYMVNYIISILNKKYKIEITNESPDIVFFANHSTNTESIDNFTNQNGKTEEYFPNSIKIYLESEYSDVQFYVNKGNLYYAIGRVSPEIKNEKILNIPYFSVSTAWQLFEECEIFNEPFKWMTEKKNTDNILKEKNKFMTVIQTSTNPYRKEIFEKLNKYKKVISCGGFETNDEECSKVTKTHSEKYDYMNKILFQNESKFSLQIQSTCAPYFSQEKIIQGYASNTIPIFWGNPNIIEDGFNPKSFINCHDYNTIDEVVDRIIEIDSDDEKYLKMLNEPMFVDNKLPEYFNENYILTFIENIINKHNI